MKIDEVPIGSVLPYEKNPRRNLDAVAKVAASIEELVPSVITEARPKRSDLHPTMKPTALIERLLKNNARPGDLVFDPFGGSGSTLIAADRLGMVATLCELDPGYCDVIVARWQEYSGRKATRISDGVAFDDVPARLSVKAA